jgi:hypothetical protein
MKKEILMVKVLLVLTAHIFASPPSGEEITNVRIERKTGLSLNIGAPAFFGVALDYYVIPQINVGITLAPFMSNMGIFTVGGGGNVFPWGGKAKCNPTVYFGAHYSYGELEMFNQNNIISHMVYLPVGWSYIGKQGIAASFDVGYLITDEKEKFSPDYIRKSHLFFGLKMGYRFKRRAL